MEGLSAGRWWDGRSGVDAVVAGVLNLDESPHKDEFVTIKTSDL